MASFAVQALNLAVGLTHRAVPVDEGMRSLIALGTRRAPHSQIWKRVSRLDCSAGLPPLRRFLLRELAKAPTEVRNFYVGIGELFDRHIGFMVYLLGTHRRRSAGGPGAWLHGPWWNEAGPHWSHPTLTGLYKACRAEPIWDTAISAEESLVSGYMALSLRQLAPSIPPDRWLRGHASAALATGFPGSDAIVVGIITRRGVRPPDPVKRRRA